MKIRIVADSSANLQTLEGFDFASAPLKVRTSEREYVDDASLNVDRMLEELSAYHGKSGSSCPNVNDWLEAFGDADIVYGVALTGAVSGGYNAACAAAREYIEMHPGRRVFILDSLSTGPELELLLERYAKLIRSGADFEAVCAGIKEYHRRTHLLFTVESLQNFVNSGRVKPAVAMIARMLGICIVGRASVKGELEPLHKGRGSRRSIQKVWQSMVDMGYVGGKVRIRHSNNEAGALLLAEEIRSAFPQADLTIGRNGGICSYYVENGGIMVGFEGNEMMKGLEID